jgi:formamidopyrimidine-DNA glycosylase
MPELPEVEVTARNLRRWLRGRTVDAVEIPATRIVRPAGPRALVELLDGAVVRAVERRGKWLRLRLSTGTLYSHLGMTGKWVKRRRQDPSERHERARLDAGPSSVRYLDARLFGRLVAAHGEAPIAEWAALGPDPLVDGLDPAQLRPSLARIRRSIKETLLDQRLFAGVGNIQATEALWRARLNPERPASSLSAREVGALVRAIDASINETLQEEEGPEIRYVEEPGAPNPFRVYARQGEPCPRDGSPLQRIVQGGRATVFCARCQR